MRSNELRRYEMFVRVVKFGDRYRTQLAASPPAKEAMKAIETVVTELGDHVVSKLSTDPLGKRARRIARERLWTMLEAFARTARAIAESTPGLEDKFQLPVQGSDQELVAAGRMFARDAEAFKAQFLAHAMPKKFLADLAEAADRLDRATGDRQGERDGNNAARANIMAALAAGSAAVQKLDVIVANMLGDDRVAMQVWQQDRHVGVSTRKAKKGKPAPAPAPAPAPVATTPPAPAQAPPVPAPASPASSSGLDAGIPTGPALATKVA